MLKILKVAKFDSGERGEKIFKESSIKEMKKGITVGKVLIDLDVETSAKVYLGYDNTEMVDLRGAATGKDFNSFFLREIRRKTEDEEEELFDDDDDPDLLVLVYTKEGTGGGGRYRKRKSKKRKSKKRKSKKKKSKTRRRRR